MTDNSGDMNRQRGLDSLFLKQAIEIERKPIDTETCVLHRDHMLWVLNLDDKDLDEKTLEEDLRNLINSDKVYLSAITS
eukprot:UN22391